MGVASVYPVFKNADQYRSISLRSITSRLFEVLISRMVVEHLDRNNLLYEKYVPDPLVKY